ncbi:unnamed protein product, partial [Rotaria sordida]
MPSLILSTHPFTRNVSCPTQDTLSSSRNILVNKKYSSSTNTLHYYFHSRNNSDISIQENNSNLVEKFKINFINFFKTTNINENDFQQNDFQQSTFIYDPEIDLSEEY